MLRSSKRAVPTRREAVRYDSLIRCQAVRERDFRLVGDEILDLSKTGLLVRRLTPVLTGESLLLTFKAASSNRWLDLEATVARVVHGRRPGDETAALGLELHDVPSSSRILLARELMGRRPVRPRAPRPRLSFVPFSPHHPAAASAELPMLA